MNILYIAHESGLGGASLSLLGMIDELKNKNKISVIVRQKEGPFIDELNKRGVEVIYVKYFSWIIPRPDNVLKRYIRKVIQRLICTTHYYFALKMSNSIKSRKFDIVHTNSSIINFGAILAKVCGLPHIWHIREFAEEDFNLMYTKSRKQTFRFMESKSTEIICISKALYAKYSQLIDRNKMKVIYNGIAEGFLAERTQKREADDAYQLLICGRVSAEKGQKEAILAVNELLKRGFSNIHLHIAGEGEILALQQFVKVLGIEKHITFHGRVNDMLKLRMYIDIELVCSKMEGFGRVTIEAMMSSIPVVGANTGGTPELIKDSFNGFLYKQGDSFDLADKVEYFLNHPEYLHNYGRNAYLFSRENFTASKNAALIFEEYKRISREYCG